MSGMNNAPQMGSMVNTATDQPTGTPKQLSKMADKPKQTSRSEFLKTISKLQQTPTNSGYSP